MPDLTPEAWAQIRYAYEHTDRPIEDICAEHGFSSGTLRDRVRRWRWTRRRMPIPLEGPPAAVAPQNDYAARALPLPHSPSKTGVDALVPGEVGIEQTAESEMTPTPSLPLAGGGSTEGSGGGSPDASAAAPPDSDPALIGPRLQSAVARVLPAIEATIARLAGGPRPPRELEQIARALGTLTRTLRELNALLAQHRVAAGEDAMPEDMPEDVDEFRNELARRIDAFVASRSGNPADGAGTQHEPQAAP